MALISVRKIMAAVQTKLEGDSITVYLVSGPEDPASAGKFCILRPYSGDYDGSLGDPTQDCEVQFQAMSVGSTPEQAMWLHDAVANSLSFAVLAPDTGVTTLPIRAIPGSGQPVLPDDDIKPAVYYAVRDWQVKAIPS